MCTPRRFWNTRSGRPHWGCVLLLLFNTALMAAGPDTAGLVLYLPMESALNPIDASANPTTVTVLGSLSAADGQLGTRGLAFNGDPANRLEIAHAPKLEGMSTLTIEAWAFPQNIASHEGMAIVSKRIANQNGDAYNLFIWTGQRLEARVNATGGINSTTVLQNDTWYHIAYTFDAQAATGQKTKLYVNGILEATGDHTATAAQGSNGGGAPVWVGELDAARGFPWDGVLDEIGIWNIALTEEDVSLLMVQTKAKMLSGGIASNPMPPDGSDDILRSTDLSWTAGEYAATHDVYFGLSREDVNAAAPAAVVAQGLARDVDSVDVGYLDFGRTYYWRVDEVNGAPDFAVLKGDVWSFTVEPIAYPVENVLATSNGISDAVSTAQRTVDGSGINDDNQASIESGDMWLATPPAGETLYIQYEFDRIYKLHEMLVWNYNVQFELVLGFGLKGVTIEYSENGADWIALGDFELARATAKATYTANTAVPFDGVPAKFVRLNVTSGWGMMGQYGLSEVRFVYIPAQAREPQPADGAVGVEPATTLSWRAGREAASHEVHLGTDPNALTLAGTADSATFAPALEFGSTYYWQIVEVNEADAVPSWAGDVWSFSTQEYVLIDGFETYTDNIDAHETIFDTWLDGWVNDTGSTVGYLDAPFAEKTIVRSGRQSMPLQYDNSTTPFYSETEREFQTAQNWTGNGADTLVLYVRGNAPSFVETADGGVIMSAVGTDIWDTTDQFRYAYKNLTGDGSMTVRVDSLVRSNEWAKAGVMIRETLEPGSKHAFAALTPEPSHGLSFQRRPVAGQASGNTDVANIPLPHWVRLTRTGNVFAAQQSADGVTWTDVVVSPALEIQMAGNVYIGLALCSHDAAIVTAAEFSNLSTTGNVTGAWQTAEIGVAQPAGNSSESMYVTIEDAAGKTAMVVNADAAITVRPTWQEWAIPYSDLSGVNLGRVQKMVIGVGSKTSPKAGGTGTVYIDDIGYGRPAAE
ncbi:MAG: hypothetical protein GXY19_04875 [Phycisphaerae bacterium]|nr:hypothetical protein [Phycisphaerae bacterium]